VLALIVYATTERLNPERDFEQEISLDFPSTNIHLLKIPLFSSYLETSANYFTIAAHVFTAHYVIQTRITQRVQKYVSWEMDLLMELTAGLLTFNMAWSCLQGGNHEHKHRLHFFFLT
jgi:hypothetical protein